MRPRSYDLERIYPKDALRHELQAMVRVICQVREDGSPSAGVLIMNEFDFRLAE